MSKKMEATVHIRQVVCRSHHIHWIRGLLIVHYRRDITWTEFRKMVGLGERFQKYLAHGQRLGGRETVRKLIEGTRRHGIMIHLSDFYEDENPNQEPTRIWQPWKDYKY